MNLISPEEFKKNRKTNIEPPATRSGGLNLISPDEFKAERTKQTVEKLQTLGEGFKQIGQTLVSPFAGLARAFEPKPDTQQPPVLDQSTKNALNTMMRQSLQNPLANYPVQSDGRMERPPYLERVRQAVEESNWPQLLRPISAGVQAINQLPISQAFQEGLRRLPMGSGQPEKYKPVGGVAGAVGHVAADIAASVTTPGAGLGGVGMYQQAGNVMARHAPKLAGTTTGTLAKGAAVGAPVSTGAELVLNPEASGKELAMAAGLGAVGGGALDAAGDLVGRGIRAGIQARSVRSAKETAQEILESATGRKAQPAKEGLSRSVTALPKKRPIDLITDEGLTINYARNKEKAPFMGKEFGQDIEPAGEYIIHDTMGGINKLPNWEYGEITFKKPLVIEWETTGHGGWKSKLSERYGGKTGKALSTAVKKDGYDGIVTIDSKSGDILETVNLSGAKRPSGARGSSSVQAMAQTADGRPLLPRAADVGDAVSKNVTKRSDIIADLSKELGIPIRTGRYRQKAHGIFKVKSSVVRTKLTNDLPVISHEVGHALDKRYKLSSSQFDNELLALGKNTSGPGYSKNQIRDEGVAEFFRLMLTEPEASAQKAPLFHQQFINKVSAKDKAALLKAQMQIRQYIDQDILTKSFSELSVGQREKRKLPSLRDLYTKFIDDIDPIKQALKPLGDKGRELFENFWLLRGASGRAQAFLWQGVVDRSFSRIGKSYDEIITPVKQNLNEFRTYIKDKRALELADRNIMTGSDLTPEERLRAITKMEQLHPEFKQAQQGLKDYQDALLDELIESGMLNVDDVRAFKDQNKEYVPFFRVFEAEAGSGASKGGRTHTGSGAADQSSPIRRIKGSDREIVDPLESIIKNTYQYITIAERNKAMREFIDAVVDADNLGGLVEKIPAPMQGKSFSLEELRGTLERAGADVDSIDMDTIVSIFRPANVAPGKENVIRVFRNGKQEFYQLDPDLYRAVTAADREQMNFLVRAANMPVRMLRSGIVNTLEFWFKNMFRDQFEALVKSEHGYIPYIDLVRGMYHVLGRTDTFTKFLAAGGAQGLRQSLDRRYLQHDLRRILATSMRDKAMNVLKNPLEAMRALSELSEMGTRVGDFAKGIKKDSSRQGIKRAAVRSRDLMDFGRAGTWGRDINKISTFWNSQMQGLDKTIRVFTNPKTAPKAFAKASAFITAPTAALYYKNKNDPRYQELPQWDKDLFWHFWVGKQHFRVPIPFELGVMFKVLPERLLSFAEGEDDSFRGFGQTAYDAVDVIPDISALTPWIEAYANRNFIGAPIVPRREEDMLPEDQAGPYTSNTAKLIARIPGVNDNYVTERIFGSPRKVDHIIRGYTGSLGQYATQLIDTATDAAGITSRAPRPEADLSDKPLTKAFAGREFGGSTDSIDKFYDRVDKLTEQSKRAEKKGVYFEGAGELQYLEGIKKMISDTSKRIRAVESDPNMSPKEKRDEIRRLNLMSNNFARMGLGLDQLEYADVFGRTP